MRVLTLVVSFICFFCLEAHPQRQNIDYYLYHKGIIDAEQAIFINNDASKGLDIFKNTFSQFDFVFIDDCIEAFQLALFFKKEDYAMVFIKKAIENGFELDLLDRLSLSMLDDLNRNKGRYVTIHKDFVKKNKPFLEVYSKKSYPKFLKRINKTLFTQTNTRHVLEQLFKNFHSGLTPSIEVQTKSYLNISANNLHFFDSLAQKHIFLGEKNMGCYTQQLADSLTKGKASIKTCLENILQYYHLPSDTYVPVITDGDYYGLSPVYNMLFHNPQSYQTLLKYRDEAIKLGYWHPREFASLKFGRFYL